MAEELLNYANINTILQQQRGGSVPEHVRSDVYLHPGRGDCFPKNVGDTLR